MLGGQAAADRPATSLTGETRAGAAQGGRVVLARDDGSLGGTLGARSAEQLRGNWAGGPQAVDVAGRPASWTSTRSGPCKTAEDGDDAMAAAHVYSLSSGGSHPTHCGTHCTASHVSSSSSAILCHLETACLVSPNTVQNLSDSPSADATPRQWPLVRHADAQASPFLSVVPTGSSIQRGPIGGPIPPVASPVGARPAPPSPACAEDEGVGSFPPSVFRRAKRRPPSLFSPQSSQCSSATPTVRPSPVNLKGGQPPQPPRTSAQPASPVEAARAVAVLESRAQMTPIQPFLVVPGSRIQRHPPPSTVPLTHSRPVPHPQVYLSDDRSTLFAGPFVVNATGCVTMRNHLLLNPNSSRQRSASVHLSCTAAGASETTSDAHSTGGSCLNTPLCDAVAPLPRGTAVADDDARYAWVGRQGRPELEAGGTTYTAARLLQPEKPQLLVPQFRLHSVALHSASVDTPCSPISYSLDYATTYQPKSTACRRKLSAPGAYGEPGLLHRSCRPSAGFPHADVGDQHAETDLTSPVEGPDKRVPASLLMPCPTPQSTYRKDHGYHCTLSPVQLLVSAKEMNVEAATLNADCSPRAASLLPYERLPTVGGAAATPPANVMQHSDLEFIAHLGKGASATVFRARHRPTGRKLAVKCIDLTPLLLSPTGDESTSQTNLSFSSSIFAGGMGERNKQLQNIVIRELQALHSEYRSPFMVKLYNAFYLERMKELHVVMECMEYGSLDRLAQLIIKSRAKDRGENGPCVMSMPTSESRTGTCADDPGAGDPVDITEGEVPERVVAVVGEQLLRGVCDMHRRNVVHRDIKPGNVLVNELGIVKISDFGLSEVCASPSVTHTFSVPCSATSRPGESPQSPLPPLKLAAAGLDGSQLIDRLPSDDDDAPRCSGTDRYMSPERHRGEKHGKPSDIWAVGMTLAEFAVGQYPVDFVDCIDEFDRVSRMEHVDLTRFPRRVPLSDVFLDYIRLCMLPRPQDRPTAEELLEHPFFRQWSEPFQFSAYLPQHVSPMAEDSESLCRDTATARSPRDSASWSVKVFSPESCADVARGGGEPASSGGIDASTKSADRQME